MAAISNIRLHPAQPSDLSQVPEIPLDALPLPAAIVDANGILIAANGEWRSGAPASLPGADALERFDPIVREPLLAGIRQTLSTGVRVAQDYGTPGRPCRIAIAAARPGALLIQQQPASGHTGRPHAEKMETVGRLVGGVAHDFANLLTMICGYTDILLNRLPEQDPLRAELDEIRKAANRGSRLTRQLLGFTRGQSVQPRALDLNAVVVDLKRMLALVIGEHVDLQTDLAADLKKVIADAGQMEQVVMNLILNARDAMPAGGRIRIETSNGELSAAIAREHSMRPGPCVTLSITDTGHGIDSAALAHIFEPLYTTKEHGKGTGLGLSTVHRIVKESGGDIWVDSAPGEGATFTICLPAAASASPTGDIVVRQRPPAEGHETLLLVEDDEGVRRLLTNVLERGGYRVLEASSGEEALALFDRHGSEVHLVLTDMVMPLMSGRELGDRLRRIRPALEIIYMSGYTDDVLVRTGALGPGMTFLQKPLRPDVLAAKVRETLDRSLINNN